MGLLSQTVCVCVCVCVESVVMATKNAVNLHCVCEGRLKHLEFGVLKNNCVKFHVQGEIH